MKEREKLKETPKFLSLGKEESRHSVKQMFGKNDDGFHVRNTDFEVLTETLVEVFPHPKMVGIRIWSSAK